MDPGLFQRKQPGVYQLLDAGVVLGELEELPVPEEIGTAVTDLPDEISPLEQGQHRGCRPHPRLSCSDRVRSKIASLAARIAVRTRSLASWSDNPRSKPMAWDGIRTAISLATSPAACPPIPSATMKIPRSESMR